MKKKIKKIAKYIFWCFLFIFLAILFTVIYANWKISSDTKNFIYDDVNEVPKQKVALVLGASRKLKGGYLNPYFTYRIEAATELYKNGKVSTFVVSGDNSRPSYNEPQDMKDALVANGIPDSIIYMDYAGFRTLDSVVRLKEIFGQDSCVVVSQKFHNERAIYIAHHYNIKAYGYNAEDVQLNRLSFKTNLREKFAKVKVFIDILIGKEPKFLGDKIIIK